MEKSQYLLYLKSLPLFHSLENSLLKKMVAVSSVLEFVSTNNIRESLSHEELIIVLEGELHFTFEDEQKKVIEVLTLKKGETLSLEALLNQHCDQLAIYPAKHTALIKIPFIVINNMVMHQSALQQNLLQILQKNLRDSYHILAYNIMNSAD
jgi:CRP-like cAMP-binding protein